MLYDPTKPFTDEEFQSPGKEYRGAPFWAWNCELKRDELLRQVGYFKEMGFGGFHIHVRSGLSTPYMSREFLDLVQSCTEEAERNGLLTWLYDEDRWPSGFAGGEVTREHPEFRKRFLLVSPTEKKDCLYRVARFDIQLNSDGTLASYRALADGERAQYNEWFAQVMEEKPSPRYNNTVYADTLNPRAIERFVEVTHEKYKERLGDRFGKSIPAIFTDEPQFTAQSVLPFSGSREDVRLAWTDDLPDTYANAYPGGDLIAGIPELIWNLPEGRPSVIRYRFHDHACERFVSAHSGTIGSWCDREGLLFTGHVLSEPTLRSQTVSVGEAMRYYRSMSLPGIDMLCGSHELTTAKQAQSVVRQMGKCGMMSELYGVLGWDLDFRGHKHHGDWQAAMGVTLRVPHLSWVSMKGEGKRDYPQSIFYQSPWYRKYALIEDHFARLNTVLTRGKACVKVAVVHPIESYWLHFGAMDTNAADCEQLERNFADITEWLAFSGIDFDYLCESLLPSLCPAGSSPLRVGEAAYSAVIVPACETLRESTLDLLDAFRKAGGTLIFLGDAPTCVNAIPDARPALLCNQSIRLSFSRAALMRALEPFRECRITEASGAPAQGLLTQLRLIDGEKWFFAAHGTLPEKPDIPQARELKLEWNGSYTVQKYDTVTGKITALPASTDGSKTVCAVSLYEHDSLLLRLTPTKGSEPPKDLPAIEKKETERKSEALPVPARVGYRLSEPNVYLLDMAEYSLDGEEWQTEEEILRIDNILRKRLGWQESGGGAAQPYCIPKEPASHKITLRMRIRSEVECTGIALTLEHPQDTSIRWNGEDVPNIPNGYYADRDIHSIPLPDLKKGENLLVIEMPFEKRVALEWCHLLGRFGVRVCGREKTVTPAPDTLAFGNIVSQGFPFYSGEVTYQIPVTLPRKGSVLLHVPQYRAAVLELKVDGEENGTPIAFSPYNAQTDELEAGDHLLELTAYLNRTNTFGPVHNADRKETWLGHTLWRTSGDRWTYEYELTEEGVIHSPVLRLI